MTLKPHESSWMCDGCLREVPATVHEIPTMTPLPDGWVRIGHATYCKGHNIQIVVDGTVNTLQEIEGG